MEKLMFGIAILGGVSCVLDIYYGNIGDYYLAWSWSCPTVFSVSMIALYSMYHR